jgi:hypothetical protein
MTPLAQPAASPQPGGIDGLACIWDNMGYHGTIWASMDHAAPGVAPAIGVSTPY